MMRASLEDRFWARITPEPNSGCWLWTGSVDRLGYGRVREFFSSLAHRVSYSLTFGRFDQQLLVCHRCDVPGCVNPQHLFLGTWGDNARDAQRKGRLYRPRMPGELHPLARLNRLSVEAARQRHMAGESIASIARNLGVAHQTASDAVKGITWSTVNP